MNYLEMLAKLGVGSAHPGGFSATLELLRHNPIPAGSKILDAGCGTGRTACYLAKQGYDVTGIDIHPGMIRKAQRRAEEEQVEVCFVQGDVCSLPFAEEQFDVVLAESVSVFVDTAQAVSEFWRVLKTGGMLYDTEIMALRRIHSQFNELIRNFYGIKTVMSPEQWTGLLTDAGFVEAGVWNLSSFPENLWEDQIRHPDFLQYVDEDVWIDRRIWQLSVQYDHMVQRFRDVIGYGVILGRKGKINTRS